MSRFAYSAVNLYARFFNNLTTKFLQDLLNLASVSGGNENSPFMMLAMVSLWYSDSKGVTPVISLNIVTPKAQRSTLSSYPPP
jgi:hypothetical protein